MTLVPFADRLGALALSRSLLVVGIDPDEKTLAHWNLPATAQGARSFALGLLDAVGEHAALFKPQVAFFERFGIEGLTVLLEVQNRIREAGALVLSDAKRLDIDSTFAAYAKAWLGEDAPFASDAVTVGAYMGAESLDVMFQRAALTGTGVFPVVRSSNPGGIVLQNARLEDGRTIAESLADAITAFNASVAPGTIGPAGAVIGATLEDAASVLERLPYSYYLAPGIGAQGATVADIGIRFGADAARRALPSVSRAVAHAGPSSNALKDAVEKLKAETFALQN